MSSLIDYKIPCLDLQEQHRLLKAELLHAFERVIDQTAFSGGPFVEEFEKEFASYCHSRYAVGVSNGTTALHLAMLALGIGPGDEVIVPANTFVATAWGPSHAGAKPVFADCDPDTWEIDLKEVEKKINSRTRAVIGVHLYGMPCDIGGLQEISRKHGLYFIEDAAQAQGAHYNGTPVGGFGEMACFSFYPGKNLGACGEAGGITTNNEKHFNRLKSLRNHGSHQKYYHEEVGYNYRMGGLEGASLTVKLKYLDTWNKRRRAIAGMYQKGIKNPRIKMQQVVPGCESSWHLFVITTANRDDLMKYLNANNIFPGLHYPVPCHLQQAYKHLGYGKGDFPNSEFLASHCLSLPMYAELTDDAVAFIIDVLNRY